MPLPPLKTRLLQADLFYISPSVHAWLYFPRNTRHVLWTPVLKSKLKDTESHRGFIKSGGNPPNWITLQVQS